MHTLFVVGTPIGNLEDITLRALRVLKAAGLIAAEDTRKTRVLLDHFQIHTPLTSYFEHNKLGKLETILGALEQHDVALVSEAGMPGLSDPGYELIRAALARDVPVVVVPGPSAVISALVGSGLPTDQFVFVRFLPRKRGERQAFLRSIAHEPRTLVAYEAPHRVRSASCIPCSTVIGAPAGAAHWDEPAIRAQLQRLRDEGWTSQAAIRVVGEQSGRSKREVYALWLKMAK